MRTCFKYTNQTPCDWDLSELKKRVDKLSEEYNLSKKDKEDAIVNSYEDNYDYRTHLYERFKIAHLFKIDDAFMKLFKEVISDNRSDIDWCVKFSFKTPPNSVRDEYKNELKSLIYYSERNIKPSYDSDDDEYISKLTKASLAYDILELSDVFELFTPEEFSEKLPNITFNLFFNYRHPKVGDPDQSFSTLKKYFPNEETFNKNVNSVAEFLFEEAKSNSNYPSMQLFLIANASRSTIFDDELSKKINEYYIAELTRMYNNVDELHRYVRANEGAYTFGYIVLSHYTFEVKKQIMSGEREIDESLLNLLNELNSNKFTVETLPSYHERNEYSEENIKDPSYKYFSEDFIKSLARKIYYGDKLNVDEKLEFAKKYDLMDDIQSELDLEGMIQFKQVFKNIDFESALKIVDEYDLREYKSSLIIIKNQVEEINDRYKRCKKKVESLKNNI